MGLAEEVVLTIRGVDRTGAAFAAVIAGLRQMADGGVANTKLLQDAQERLAIQTQSLAIAQQRVALAQTDIQIKTDAAALAADRAAAATSRQAEAALALDRANQSVARSQLALASAQRDAQTAGYAQRDAQTALNDVPAGGVHGGSLLLGIGAGITTAAVLNRAIRDGAAFQSAEAQIASQTNQTVTAMQGVGQSVLDFAASGKDFYSSLTTLQGTLLPLSEGFSAAKTAALIPMMANFSQMIKAPDLSIAAGIVAHGAGGLYQGGATPVGTMSNLLDMVAKAEQMIPMPPGQLAAAFPQLAVAAKGTKVSTQDLLATTVTAGREGIPPDVWDKWLGQMFKSILINPSPTAQKVATQYHLQLGNAAMVQAGGLLPYLEQIGTAVNWDPTTIAKLTSGGGSGGIFGRKAFMALTSGSDLMNTAQTSDTIAKASGTVGTATDALNQGILQQRVKLENQVNADLTTLGLTLDNTVVPALLRLANVGLKAFTDSLVLFEQKNLGDVLGGAGNTLTHFLTPGDKGFGNLTVAKDEAARYGGNTPPATTDYAAPVIGGVRAANDATMAFWTNVWNGIAGWGGTAHAAGSRLPANFVGPLLPGQTRAPALPAAFVGPLAPGEQRGAPLPRSFVGPLLPGQTRAASTADLTPVVATALGAAATSAALGTLITAVAAHPALSPTQQRIAQIQASTPKLTPAEIAYQRDIAGNLSLTKYKEADAALAATVANTNSTTAQLNAALKSVLTVLGNPAISAEIGKGGAGTVMKDAQTALNLVMKTEATRALAAATTQVNAATVFAESVAIHHGDVQQQQQAIQQQYTASMALAKVSLDTGKFGTGKDAQLNYQDAVLRAQDALAKGNAGITSTKLGALQDNLTLAGLQKNTRLQQADVAAIVAYMTANAQALGLTPTQLAINTLQLQQQYQPTSLIPAANLIRPVTSNLGVQQAGYSTSVAELSGGTASHQSQMLALAQQQLARADAEVIQLRQQVTYLQQIAAAVSVTARNTHPHPAAPHIRAHPVGGRLRH